MTSDRMLKLMAYADGELEGAERAEVEGWIRTDNASARLVNEMAGLAELVKLGHEGSADAKAVASFDITASVMAAVKKEAPATAPVASLADARARRGKNVKVGAAVAAALALAASVFLMTRPKEEMPIAQAPVPVAEPIGSSTPGVDVDTTNTPGSSVSVFYFPSETELTTSVVVWVDETGGK